jgi:hypothetical protein
MRHLLAVWRLRQLLGDDTGQCAENSFSKLYSSTVSSISELVLQWR